MVLLKALARTPEADLVIVGRKSGGYYRELDKFAKIQRAFGQGALFVWGYRPPACLPV